MTRIEALRYVGHCVDDALASRKIAEIPVNAKLVGWQRGFEPMFVAVWSYLGVELEEAEAVDIAVDYLEEINWFAEGASRAPEYVL